MKREIEAPGWFVLSSRGLEGSWYCKRVLRRHISALGPTVRTLRSVDLNVLGLSLGFSLGNSTPCREANVTESLRSREAETPAGASQGQGQDIEEELQAGGRRILI